MFCWNVGPNDAAAWIPSQDMNHQWTPDKLSYILMLRVPALFPSSPRSLDWFVLAAAGGIFAADGNESTSRVGSAGAATSASI